MAEPTCDKCGYDLAGILDAGGRRRCPECGQWFSPPGPYDPRVLRRRWQVPLSIAAVSAVVAVGALRVGPAGVLFSIVMMPAVNWIATAVVWARTEPPQATGDRFEVYMAGALMGFLAGIVTVAAMLVFAFAALIVVLRGF